MVPAILTRSPRYVDSHVLCAPLAFTLSQDQTLKKHALLIEGSGINPHLTLFTWAIKYTIIYITHYVIYTEKDEVHVKTIMCSKYYARNDLYYQAHPISPTACPPHCSKFLVTVKHLRQTRGFAHRYASRHQP